MKLVGEQRIPAPRQLVWQALNDPEILRSSIPGCQSLDREAEDRFGATVEVKVGPIGARFKGAVSLSGVDPPNGYTLGFQGSGGIAGSVKGNAQVRLRDDGAGTLLTYDVDARVGGRMTQLGGPIIDATSKQLAGKFFSRFGEIVTGAKPEQPVTPKATTVATTAAPNSWPLAWILGVVVAVLTGFLIGRTDGNMSSPWAGLAIGLLVVVVAGAAFEYGRRSASSVILLDSAGLRRLLDGVKE